MPNTIYIDYDDADAVAAINRAVAACRDPQRVLGNIGEALVSSTKGRFASETDPTGVPWAALSPRYMKAKARKYPGQPILRRENKLYESIVAQVQDDTLLVGTNATSRDYPYPLAMQFGAPARNVPPRPFLGVSADDEQTVARITLNYIRAAIDGE